MKKTKRNKQKRGGKVIASGGYGCVFDPPLSCRGQKNNSNTKTQRISKLMTIKKAEEEKEEIDRVKYVVQSIKNYNKYFIVDDIDICIPEPLSSNDLEDFDHQCTIFQDVEQIFQTNVNKQLDHLRLLNMPNGGINMEEVFTELYKNNNKYNMSIEMINDKLIELLQYGILAMNKKNGYHCDVKGPNVVYNLQTQEMKLIDWGWASVERRINDIDAIPVKFKYLGSFYFNYPLGSVLLSDDFQIQYSTYITTHAATTSLFNFLVDFIYECLNGTVGHIAFMDIIVQSILKSDPSIPLPPSINTTHTSDDLYKYNTTINLFANHLLYIVENFVDYDRRINKVNVLRYLKEKYLPDIDKCGFLSIYMQLITLSLPIPFLPQLNAMFYKYLYQPSIRPINSNELIRELKQLTNASKRKISVNISKSNTRKKSKKK